MYFAKYGIIIIVVIIGGLATLGNWDKGSSEDFIASQVGLKADKIGMISLIEDYSILSVIVKLPNITDTMKPDKRELNMIDHCAGNDISEFARAHKMDSKTTAEREFKESLYALFHDTENRNLKYIQSRLDILKPYVMLHQLNNNRSRNKRSLLAFLGSTVLTMAMSGISEYQIYKINLHHLKIRHKD